MSQGLSQGSSPGEAASEISNHFSAHLSDLDMRIVETVPEEGSRSTY